MMKRWWAARIAKMAVFFIISTTIVSLLVMLLWNYLVPSIFNGPSLSFFQALALLLLLRVISFSLMPWRRRNRQQAEHWRRKFEQSIASMPLEQREKLKELCANKCKGGFTDKKSTQKSASTYSQ